MNSEPTKALVIEDDAGYARILQKRLSQETQPSFEVVWSQELRGGLEQLAKGQVDVVVLDLILPDSQGLDTLQRLRAQAPEVPVVVLTGLDDETLAVEAVRRGAQEYLVKSEVAGKLLARVLRSAMERHRLQESLRNLALLDDLTGLYNRRGFLALAEHHIKLAQRTRQGFLLLFADLDGLKQINDASGHAAGDLALISVAKFLRESFRGSDVVARIGGDEFAVLALQAAPDGADLLRTRVAEALAQRNAQPGRSQPLSLSIGAAAFDQECPLSINELLVQADASLYDQKRQKGRTT